MTVTQDQAGRGDVAADGPLAARLPGCRLRLIAVDATDRRSRPRSAQFTVMPSTTRVP